MKTIRIKIIDTVTSELGTHIVYLLFINGVQIETDDQESEMVASAEEFEAISRDATVEDI